MIAILGGLGAALCWAISTLCSSRSSRMLDPIVVVAWVMLVGLVITVGAAAISGVPEHVDTASAVWLAISGAGNVAGLYFAYSAMRVGLLAIVAPLISTEGAVAAVIALLAGESVSVGVGVTLGVIAVGITVTSRPGTRVADQARAADPATIVRALIAALCFGTSLYATGKVGARLPTSWVVLSARVIGALALALPLALRGRLELTARAAPLLVTAGVCEVLGFYAYTAGARHGIAVAAVLSSQFAVISALGAYRLFGERLSRTQLAGVGTVIVGVALLTALRA
jgi:drug/metabolite transporter (DMT)-like permease